ncbi:tape measure protein [Burkholderia gladioli]|uniref:tape measure protein n=1 Tax=Burkholderia gladioli TaxID=28095 RepID=UPI00164148AC|nr:tape measure protein [Burkholderia gladioli]
MSTSLRELVVAVTANTTAFDSRMGALSSRSSSYFNAVVAGGRAADQAFASNAASVQVTVSAIEGATGAVRGWATAAAAAFSVHQLIEYADEWTNLSNRLKIVTRDQIDFAVAQSDVLKIARETRQPLDATAELYQRIANNTQNLGLSIRQVGPLVQTISKAVALSGVSADTARMGIVQLGQAFASGQLRGQDLNSVLEELPAVADAIARGMGTSSARLKAMAEEGKLTVTNLVDALRSASTSTDSLFAKVDQTVGQSMTRLQTEVIAYVGRANDATGASGKLAQGITYVAENLETIVAVSASLAAGRLGVYFLATAAAATRAAVAWVASSRALVDETIKQRDAAAAAVLKATADNQAAAAKLTNAQAAEVSAAAELAGMRAMRESLAMQTALTAGSIEYTQAKVAEARAIEAAAAAQVSTARGNVANSQEIGARIIGTPYAAVIARETAAAQRELERAEASLSLAQQRRTSLEAALNAGQIDQKRYAASLADTDRALSAAEREVAVATQARERAERAATSATAGLAGATERSAAAQAAFARSGSMLRTIGSGLLGAVGGLPGIVATLGTVALGAAANWLLFRDNASSATSSLIDMQAPLDQIIGKYRQLTPLLQEAERLRAQREQASSAKDAKSGFDSLAVRAAQSVVPPTYGDVPIAVSDADQAALDRFLAGLDALKKADIGVDAKSQQISGLIDTFVSATQGGAELREELVRAAGSIDTAALAANKSAQALEAMNAAASNAADGVRLLTSANDFFASGMAAEGWDKYIRKIKEEADVIGLSAQAKGEYEAKSKGANDAQARQAGLITGRADSYKKLEKAIEDKDARAAAGARANIDNLTRELALMNQQMVVAGALHEFQAELNSKKYDKFGFTADAAVAAAAARGKKAYEDTLKEGADQTAKVASNAAANPKRAATRAVTTPEGDRTLDNIKQRIAQLKVEAVASDKLTQSEKDLLGFDQKVTDLRSKRTALTAADKSVLQTEQAIRAAYQQAAQLEHEVRQREAINKLKERSAQIDAELADYASERGRDVQRQLGAMSQGDNARDLNEQINRVSDEFRRRRDELTKGARKDGVLNSPEFLSEIDRINKAELEQVERERGYMAQRLAMQSDWRVGASRAMAVYQESAQNAAQMAEDAFTNFFRNSEDAMVSFVTTGKLNFRSLVNSMLTDLARYAARAAMVQGFSFVGSIIKSAAGALTGSLGGGYSSNALLGGALPGGGAGDFGVGGNSFGFSIARAAGGIVRGPGTATSDSIDAKLSDGEFVVRASAVARPGVRGLLERINADGMGAAVSSSAAFASGGFVGSGAAAPGGGAALSIYAPVTVEGNAGAGQGQSGALGDQLRSMIESMLQQLLQREMRPGGLLWRMQNQRA